MNADIANIIKDYIKDLPFVDRITGLVRPVTKIDLVDLYDEDNEIIGQSQVRKVFPVSCDVTEAQCNEEGSLYDFVPNSDLRSLVYFEDRGAVLIDTRPREFVFRSVVRLVCWMNLNRFNRNGCSISAPVMASILKALPKGHFNSSPYTKASITVGEIQPKTSAIFSQYTYNEEVSQYLLYPFDYFAMDFIVEYSINENCISDIEVKAEDCQ